MRKLYVAAAAAALALATTALAASPTPPPTIAAAVANPARGADNAKLDASRKPADVLGWSG